MTGDHFSHNSPSQDISEEEGLIFYLMFAFANT